MRHRFNVGDRVISLDEGYDAEPGWPYGTVKDTETSQDGYSRNYYVSFEDGTTWLHFEHELEHDTRTADPEPRKHTLPEDSKARKQYPLFTGPVLYFPAALAAVAKLCRDGNDKHNPGEPMHHARGKSNDHEDCILRHMLDAREGNGRDADGTPHLVMNAWRALALLQEWLEKHDGAPRAPAASKEG